MKRVAVFFFMIILRTACFAESGSRNVECMVSGLMQEQPVPVAFAWELSWFSRPSDQYNHDLARFACMLADVSYTDVRTDPQNNVLRTNYRLLGIRDDDMEFHYDVDYDDPVYGNDQCAFSIASVPAADGTAGVVLVVIRGTPLNVNEWLSNLNINDAGRIEAEYHQGFYIVARQVYHALHAYVEKHGIAGSTPVLITGHSRGAAVANLLGAELVKAGGFTPEQLFVYTFATPNVTTDSDAGSSTYGYIWNIVNAEDIVPSVPLYRGSWQYRKYGRTRTLVNACNTDTEFFSDRCLPAVNAMYRYLTGREYHPFTTGPFVPIILTSMLYSFNENVSLFYSGTGHLHKRSSRLLAQVFSDVPDEESKTDKKRTFGERFVSWLNRRSHGLVDYIQHALFDMHYDSLYLAFLLSLDESRAFSDIGYSILVVRGAEECAVVDSQDNVQCRVMDGFIKFGEMVPPVIAVPTFSGRVVIGFPGNAQLQYYLTDETLFPTSTDCHIEHFDSNGVYLESSEPFTLYPRRGTVYAAPAGQAMVGAQALDAVLLKGREAWTLIKRYDLDSRVSFMFEPEVAMDSRFLFTYGFRAGIPLLYGTLLAGNGLAKFGKTFDLQAGIGNQQSLAGPFKWDTELLLKCIFGMADSDENERFNLATVLRTSLSCRVVGKVHVFAAGVFDFTLPERGDTLFMNPHRISDSVSVFPHMQIGIRF